ncbi:CTP synthase [Bifidobacterium ramosum]|uniref:CTP synthase n=1 Tax=Bifidobacterium ramosum TaxID=1798158 RepID=A0A6L4WYE7_9BIFI|nr:CTP synthase [Bifidobacterium ramosum]KAB8287012.1 CTP synthase [Bifidobacterium ramosum]
MRTHTDIDRLSATAERNQRCFAPETNAQRQAAITRLRSGALVRPYHNAYARTAYWTSLSAAEQARHLIRELARQRPNRVFAGLSAAAMLELEYGWSLHGDGMVFLASPAGGATRSHASLRRLIIRHPPVVTIVRTRERTGIVTTLAKDRPEDIVAHAGTADIIDMTRITAPERTLVDCGLRYSFVQALPMFDSALRRGLVTRDGVLEMCDGMHADCGPVLRLLHYANPLNENGGESLCYATIIEEGFVVPELQHVFLDPDAPWVKHRADFVWHTPDGRVIVLEYDGTDKYVNPAMTKRRDIRDVVRDERAREDALRRAGVTAIIRTSYDEVIRRYPLRHKLLDARVPMTGMLMHERRTDARGRER